jgi:putative DNA primase/helicase
MFDLFHAAKALGGEVGNGQVSCPGPDHSAEDRSLCVKFGPAYPDGFLVYSHSGDDWMVCRDYVRQKCGLHTFDTGLNNKTSSTLHQVKSDEPDRIRFALDIWHDSQTPYSTVVEDYLVGRSLSLDASVASEAIRFHPALKYRGQKMQAMVCLFRDIFTNEPCGIHRTFLTADGAKLNRKMLGRCKGVAIKLDANETVTGDLFIGEGVESCLAGRLAGFHPAWALGSAPAIGAFPVLSGIDSLTIFMEADDNGVNEKATMVCARRWLKAGAEVIGLNPLIAGDMADVWMEAVS